MNDSIVIGPFALQVGVVVALAAVALGWFVAGRAGRAGALKLDGPLYAVSGVGLLAARVAYVLQHGAAYLSEPLSVLNVRDGGWSAAAGFAAAAATAALLVLRRRSLARPLALGLATAAAVWFVPNAVEPLLGGGPAHLPDRTLRALDGRPVALDAFRGRPVVLNLWATWCPPCIREMPVLQQAQRQRPDVHFVFVNQGEQPQRVQAFLAGRGLHLDNVLLDTNGDVAGELGARGLPTTAFFDAQGRLAGVRVGELTAGALAARLDAVQGAPASAP